MSTEAPTTMPTGAADTSEPMKSSSVEAARQARSPRACQACVKRRRRLAGRQCRPETLAPRCDLIDPGGEGGTPLKLGTPARVTLRARRRGGSRRVRRRPRRRRDCSGRGATLDFAVVRRRSGGPALRRTARRAAGGNVDRDPERRCQRGLQRRHAPSSSPARRGHCSDLGGGGGRQSVGMRRRRPSVLPYGIVDVFRDGLPNRRALHDLHETSRLKLARAACAGPHVAVRV